MLEGVAGISHNGLTYLLGYHGLKLTSREGHHEASETFPLLLVQKEIKRRAGYLES